MQLEDFNNIDFNNAGNLPAAMKAILLAILAAIILVLGYLMLINPNLKKLKEVEAKETELREAFIAKKSQSIKIESYRLQMKEIEHTFGALLKQLPGKSEMDGLLTDINQAGLGRGLEFDSFVPQEEVVQEFYAEKPIHIKVLGNYHDLGAFATDVSKLSRIVTLNDVQVQPMGKEAKDGRLMLEATAKTYRYLDAEEIAARKAKEQKEKKK